MPSTGDIIQRAIAYWDTHGWCGGQLQDLRGRVCAIGALRAGLFGRVQGTNPLLDRMEVGHLAQVIARYLPADFEEAAHGLGDPSYLAGVRIASYNDRMGYKAIREVFEKAALNEGVTL